MFVFNPIVRLFLILVLLFVCVGVVAAQEVTPEPTAPPPVELPPDSVVTSGGQLLLLLGLAVLSGGGLLAVLYRFLESKQVLDTSEKLYQSTPPETQKFINDLVAGLHETTNRLLTYLDKITDGQPNE